MPLPYPLNPLGISRGSGPIPLTLTAVEPSTVRLSIVAGSPTVSGLHYRPGTSGTWLPYTIDTEIPLSTGQKVQWWNSASALNTMSNTCRFFLTGGVEASGVLESMANWAAAPPAYCFNTFFSAAAALLSAPDMTASALSNRCYAQCMENCYNLTGAITLPATTPATNCYQQIVQQTKITSVRIGLESLANYCLFRSFRLCRSLSRIEVNFTSWGEDLTQPTYQWVEAVSPSGTFVKPAALPEEYGIDRIPSGWTVINK